MRSLLLLAALAAPAAAADTLVRARVAHPDAPAVAARLAAGGWDVLAGETTASTLEVVVTDAQLATLRARGHDVEVLERGRPFAEIQAEAADGGVPGGYPDLDAIVAAMSDAAAAHPSICALVDVTAATGSPTTAEGRSLYAVKISDAVATDEDEPEVLIVSAHHCRELVTPVIALDTIERLTTGYGSDPEITALVDACEIWVAPVWNPDGYAFVFSGDNLWRKNRRVFVDGVGVDLNRNYDFEWDGPCGGSSFVSSLTYRGPSAASEAETQTMVAWTAQRRFAKVLDFHSSGREVLWGYAEACSSHPFDAWLQSEAVALSVASGYAGEERPPSANGEHYEWQLAQRGAYAFLTETALSFQPSFASALSEAALVWPGTKWLLERPISLSGHVTDLLTGAPLEADVVLVDVPFAHGESYGSGGPAGRYDLVLPPGAHSLSFEAPGYGAEPAEVSVTASSSATLDVRLLSTGVPGTWTDVGFAKPGAFGDPSLVGSGSLLPNTINQLDLTDVPAATTATLLFGVEPLVLPFKDGTLVPAPLVVLPLPTGAGGGTLSFLLPAAVPSGIDLFFQFWIADPAATKGLSASNALRGVTG